MELLFWVSLGVIVTLGGSSGLIYGVATIVKKIKK